MQELRDRGYEAFPPKSDDKKAKSPDEDLADGNEDADDEDVSNGARDYDYLLSVRTKIHLPFDVLQTNKMIDAHLVSDTRAS